MKVIISLACLLTTFDAGPSLAKERVLSVSDVIKEAASLDGKTVSVRGYVRIGPESHGLWVSRRDYLAVAKSIHNLNDDIIESSDFCVSVLNPSVLSKTFFGRPSTVKIAVKVINNHLKDGAIDPWGCNDKVGVQIVSVRP